MVTDVVMPGMSGVEFARRVHDARPGVPVAMVTGRPDGIEFALEAGAVPIPKPLTRERLRLLLRDAANR